MDDTTYTPTDGRTLRDSRMAAGISMEELARRLSTTRQALRRWEQNERLPHVKAVRYQSALDEAVREAVA